MLIARRKNAVQLSLYGIPRMLSNCVSKSESASCIHFGSCSTDCRVVSLDLGLSRLRSVQIGADREEENGCQDNNDSDNKNHFNECKAFFILLNLFHVHILLKVSSDL